LLIAERSPIRLVLVACSAVLIVVGASMMIPTTLPRSRQLGHDDEKMIIENLQRYDYHYNYRRRKAVASPRHGESGGIPNP
jgi:hypothetical protein